MIATTSDHKQYTLAILKQFSNSGTFQTVSYSNRKYH